MKSESDVAVSCKENVIFGGKSKCACVPFAMEKEGHIQK